MIILSAAFLPSRFVRKKTSGEGGGERVFPGERMRSFFLSLDRAFRRLLSFVVLIANVHAHRPRPHRVSSFAFQEAGLERYAIAGEERDWSDALAGGKAPKSGILSVKRKAGEGAAEEDARRGEKTPKKGDKKEKRDRGKGGKTPKSSGKKSGKKRS